MYQPVDKGPTGAAPMADLPNLSVELSQFEESAKLSDVNVDTSSKTDVDEEAQKRVVEPQLVIAGDNSRESSPTKRFFGGSFKGPSRLSSTVLNINDLPHDVAENLRAYDINGDGLISMTELVHGAMTQHEQEEKVIFFRRMIIAFVLIWLLTMGAFFGVVYGAIEASKESRVDENSNGKGGATMVSRDNAYVVQTANSDFFVGSDGSAYVRTVTSHDFETAEGSSSGDEANFNVMKTSAAVANITFSSYIPDEVLMELKSISIRSAAGAHLSLQVHGVLRMPPDSLATVGAVTILTHIGRIVIDGTAVSFYDDTEVAIFENAGFIVKEGASVGGRRRLLDGILALFGIFNAVASLKDWDASAPAYANIPPPLLPDNFIMYSRRFAPCIVFPNIDGSITPYEGYLGGTLPTIPGVDYCDLLQISDEFLATTYVENSTTVMQRFIETEYVIYRIGSEYLRVEYVHPLHPNVTFVEVLDNSDPENPLQFHYNVDALTRGLEVTTISEELDIVEFTGPIYYYNTSELTQQNLVDQSLSSPFEYMGTTSFQGSEVRIWAMHLVNNSVHAFWYDSVATQQVQRIDYGDFGMLDVVSLIPLNESDVSAMSYLFAQPIEGVTTVVEGAVDELPFRTGVNPYDPFVADFRSQLDSQPGGSRRLYEEYGEEDPVEVPAELLIPDAEARRRRHGFATTETAPAHHTDVHPATPYPPPQQQQQQQQPQLVLNIQPSDSAAVTENADVEEAENTGNGILPAEDAEEIDYGVIPGAAEEIAAAVALQERPALLENRHHTVEEAAAPILSTAVALVDHTARSKQVQSRWCPDGWVGSNDMCYYFYSSSYSGTWDTCYNLCQSHGSQMLCIQNEAQNMFIYQRNRERGGFKHWIGLRRDANGVFNWGLGCVSSYYSWAKGEPTNKGGAYATMQGGRNQNWVNEGVRSLFCACQNPFNPPTAAPTPVITAAPTTSAPTFSPISRPTARPTMSVATRNPTSPPGTLPINLPPIPNPSEDIAAIATVVRRQFGCEVDNKCNNYYLWFQTINAPNFPVLTASGNRELACVFTSAVEVPVVFPVFPFIEFGVEAGVEIAFCNDMSALDYVLGTITVSVGIIAASAVQPPFDQIFSWQVAQVGVGIAFYVSEPWCKVDNGMAFYSSSEAYGLFRFIAQTSKGPQICRCLERGQTHPGLMYVVGGPDIPGIVLMFVPGFVPLTPFLLFTRITNSAMLENFPNTCELSISRTAMSIDIQLNLAMYTYSVNVISFQMSMVTKTGGTDFIGAYMNRPKGLDAFIDEDKFTDRYLMGAFNRAGNALQALVNKNAGVWLAVVRLGGDIAQAAGNYFKAAVDGGQVLESVAGEYTADLYKIFKPPPLIVEGCWDPVVEKSQCTKRRKVFNRSFCVRYSMPRITCGSTGQCLKHC